MATANQNLSDYDKATIPNAKDFRFGIVVSEWNPKITEGLYKGAHQTLIDNGVGPEDILRMNVPGSFELTFGASVLGETTDVDAIITLGSVIQGETKHFDFISQSVCDGIKDINITDGCPVILCLLTDDNFQQSIERSGGKHGNKGYDCAEAAAKMTLI